jgi:uncharacterized membrane protein YjjP (DUF1212 family)
VTHEHGAVDEAADFAAQLGQALLTYGTPAHRLEEALERLSKALGIPASFVAAPTSITVTVGTGAEQRTRVLRVHPGEQDLERLSDLQALVKRVEHREITPGEGTRRIQEILARRPRYGALLAIGAWGLASLAAAVLLGGGFEEAWTAAALGVLVGALAKLSERWRTTEQLLPAIAAIVVSSIAFWISGHGVPARPMLLVVAALVVLLPGLATTTAMIEIATGNLVSGTARFAGATLTFLLLTFGVALGQRANVDASLVIDPDGPARALPIWATMLAPAVTAAAFTVVLRARPADLGWILIGCYVATGGAWIGVLVLGPALGGFAGALFAAAYSHAAARWRDRPIAVTLVPAILTLVPGSLGFLSFSSLLGNDINTAIETAFRMALVAISLAAGILLATLAVPPRRPL